MVEVFKTNVTGPGQAGMLVHQIHKAFPGYRANFDLQDCDHILRVVCENGTVQAAVIIDLLQAHGFYAEPLPDEDLPAGSVKTTKVLETFVVWPHSAKASSG